MAAIDELRERLGEIHDLSRAASLLAWDERTMMPAGGAEARAETLATLARVRHEMFIDDEIGAPDRPGALRARRRRCPGESIDADLVRVVARDWEKARRVPVRAARRDGPRQLDRRERLGRGQGATPTSRCSSPTSSENVELTRRYADCFDGFPGFTARLRRAARRVRARDDDRADARRARRPAGGPRPAGRRGDRQRRRTRTSDPFRGEFPAERAARAGRAADRGAALPRGLLAASTRPSIPSRSRSARGDVRLTTRYDEGNLAMALFSAMHEAGPRPL